MAEVNAKCTNCNEEIVIDSSLDANICPKCNKAFVTEKAIKLYNANEEIQKEQNAKKRRHIWKSLGLGLWFSVKCILYLFYVLFFLWLVFDITDSILKKK